MHWVFAYGSNMHLPDLQRWLREQGYDHPGPARVEVASIQDFELAWNYRSASRGGGAANAMPRVGRALRGLALEVDEALLMAIDEKEGHPVRYDRGEAPVSAELVRAGGRIAAWLYRVTPAFEAPSRVAPRRAYLDLILEAAAHHDLGQDYVTQLHATPVVEE